MTDDVAATDGTDRISSTAPPEGRLPPETADDTPSEQPKKKPRVSRTAIEWGVLLVAAIVLALVIKTFLFQAFYIPSESMVPTLEVGDRVLVNKLSYDLHDVNRGDIVVFEAEPNPGWRDTGIDDLVKRVIGLPGETVDACGDTGDLPARCASTDASSTRATSPSGTVTEWRRSRAPRSTAARPKAPSTAAPCCPGTTS